MPARRRLRALLADRRGISAVEFALVAPVMMVLALGMVEAGRFAMLTLKLYHAASTLGDLASREERLTDAFLANSFDAVQHVMTPFDIGRDGVAIVSGIGLNAEGAVRVLWQRPGAGSLSASSAIGAEGARPTLPADLEVRDGEAVLATEVFFRYESWLLGFIPDTIVRRVTYYRPRLGALESIDAD